MATLTPRTPGPRSIVFRDQRIIAASPEAIWAVLADLPGYAAWNPWIVSARGDLVPGGRVDVEVVLGRGARPAAHVVLAVVPGRELSWRDSGWTAWLVYGQRRRHIEPLGDGTVRYTNELLVDGVLASVVKRSFGRALSAGIAAENAALAARVE